MLWKCWVKYLYSAIPSPKKEDEETDSSRIYATPKAGGEDYTDEENGIPFIRAVDLKEGRVDTSKICSWFHTKENNSEEKWCPFFERWHSGEMCRFWSWIWSKY